MMLPHVPKSRGPGHHICYMSTVSLNICVSSVWNLLHVIRLAPRNVRFLLYFFKMCANLDAVVQRYAFEIVHKYGY